MVCLEFPWYPTRYNATRIVELLKASKAEFQKFLPWSRSENSYDVDWQYNRLVKIEEDMALGISHHFLILNEHGVTIGSIGLHPRTLSTTGWELGYWVGTEYTGKGVCTLAAKLVLVYGFEYLKATRVQCLYNINNQASKKVNEKLGFVNEGVLRKFVEGMEGINEDTVMTSLIEKDLKHLSWYEEVKQNLKVDLES